MITEERTVWVTRAECGCFDVRMASCDPERAAKAKLPSAIVSITRESYPRGHEMLSGRLERKCLEHLRIELDRFYQLARNAQDSHGLAASEVPELGRMVEEAIREIRALRSLSPVAAGWVEGPQK